jgi:ABC-type bacteriocin/lantibiotic exporter with double-glycine peptidase domain
MIWYGGFKVLNDELSYGDILTFILYCRSYSESIKSFSDAYIHIVVASGIAEVLFDLLDYETKMIEYNKNGIKPDIEGNIEFKNIHFSYPTKSDVKIFFFYLMSLI